MREGRVGENGDGKSNVWRRDVEVGRAGQGATGGAGRGLRSGLAGTAARNADTGHVLAIAASKAGRTIQRPIIMRDCQSTGSFWRLGG